MRRSRTSVPEASRLMRQRAPRSSIKETALDLWSTDVQCVVLSEQLMSTEKMEGWSQRHIRHSCKLPGKCLKLLGLEDPSRVHGSSGPLLPQLLVS